MRDLPESHYHRLPDPQPASHTSTGSSLLLQPAATTTLRSLDTAQSQDHRLMRPVVTGIIPKPQRHGLNKSNRARLRKILAPYQDKLHIDQSDWSRFKLWMADGKEGVGHHTPGQRKRTSRLDEARILFRIRASDFFYYIQGGDDKEKSVSPQVLVRLHTSVADIV
jgi:hypothetical protein